MAKIYTLYFVLQYSKTTKIPTSSNKAANL